MSLIIERVNAETGEIKRYTEVEFTTERDRLLLDWQSKKDALEIAKEEEMKLRKECVALLGDPDKKSGTENVELGAGYKAKMVKKINYGFVQKDNKTDKNAIENALQKIEADGDVGVLIAERLVKWTPALGLTEYNQLSDKHKKIIDKVIVTTEGAPTLEIVEPKAKK